MDFQTSQFSTFSEEFSQYSGERVEIENLGPEDSQDIFSPSSGAPGTQSTQGDVVIDGSLPSSSQDVEDPDYDPGEILYLNIWMTVPPGEDDADEDEDEEVEELDPLVCVKESKLRLLLSRQCLTEGCEQPTSVTTSKRGGWAVGLKDHNTLITRHAVEGPH